MWRRRASRGRFERPESEEGEERLGLRGSGWDWDEDGSEASWVGWRSTSEIIPFGSAIVWFGWQYGEL